MASDPFFANGGQKRKRAAKPSKSAPPKSNKAAGKKSGTSNPLAPSREDPDEILSSEDDSEAMGSAAASDDVPLSEDEDAEEDARETAAQKRLRLAKIYLENVQQQQAGDGFDAADIDKEYIEQRLQSDVLAQTGKFHLILASSLQAPEFSSGDILRAKKGHRLPLTGAVLSPSGSHLYTSSKDGSLSKWSLSFSSPAHAPEASTSTSSTGSVKQLSYVPKTIAPSSKARAKKRKERKQIKAGTEGDLGHTDAILGLDISHDGKMLATAGQDRVLGAWDIGQDRCTWIKGLKGHKDLISSVKFRKGSTQVFTSSYDRTVKQFDLAALTYIDTLFGHQDTILNLDCLRNETALTAGGRDKSLRFWKVAEEAQLVFRGGGTSRMREVLEGSRAADDMEVDGAAAQKQTGSQEAQTKKYVEGSTEVVAMIDEQHFLSGGDSGSISLWNIGKKKPVFTCPVAHGIDETHSETEGIVRKPRWITALSTLPYSDVFASGSWDGSVRFWHIQKDLKSFKPLFTAAVPGVINGLHLVQPDGKENADVLCSVAAGQEHRLGRWLRISEGRNEGVVLRLRRSAA